MGRWLVRCRGGRANSLPQTCTQSQYSRSGATGRGIAESNPLERSAANAVYPAAYGHHPSADRTAGTHTTALPGAELKRAPPTTCTLIAEGRFSRMTFDETNSAVSHYMHR